MSYPCPRCPTVATRAHNLRTHLMGRRPKGHALSHAEAEAVIAEVAKGLAAGGGPPAPTRPRPIPAIPAIPAISAVDTDRPLVRLGHLHTLALLEDTNGVQQTLRMYERETGHAVYLRPTDAGLTVISLDPSTPAMVGVGGDDCCIDAVPPSGEAVAEAARAFRLKVGAMKRDSLEERFVLSRIRASLENGLQLDDDLLFLHQEWRFPGSDKMDLLALDVRTGQLVVIEAKKSESAARSDRDGRGRTASEQAAGYAALLALHAARAVPFFQRLASALASIYRPAGLPCPIDAAKPPRWEVWWPGGSLKQPEGSVLVPLPAPSTPLPAAHPPRDVNFVESDDPWQRELRLRQSRWRDEKGYPIGSHKRSPLGSRLAMPDAESHLWNFLTPAIGSLARQEYLSNASRPFRKRKVLMYPRLFEDLLSSQPLAFNLFGELAVNLERATVAARRLWPGRVETVTRIELEWSPGRGDPAYLENGTAADVAIFHTTPSGGSGLISVEVKYHEDLKREDSDLKPRYFEVARTSGAFLDAALPTLQAGTLQQFWLDHLLALATGETDDLESVLFVVAYPEINEPCRKAVDAYKLTLDPTVVPTFEARTLEEMVSAIGDASGIEWSQAFHARYLRPTSVAIGEQGASHAT